MAKLNTLIDKQDNCEIIRDQIAAILAVEEANQRVLAIADGQDTELWRFNVYTEKFNPWKLLTKSDGTSESQTPIVNVLFDNDTFDNKNSNQTEQQATKGMFFLDCYAHKPKTESLDSDEATSKEAERIARLVRNIIMSAEYNQLALGYADLGKGNNIVFDRYILKREKFMPLDREGRAFENIIAMRLTLGVDYVEYSPQIEPTDFDLLYFKCEKSEDGQLLFDLNFDMTE